MQIVNKTKPDPKPGSNFVPYKTHSCKPAINALLIGCLDVVLEEDDRDDVELLLDQGLLHLQAHLQIRVLPAGGLQVEPRPKTYIKESAKNVRNNPEARLMKTAFVRRLRTGYNFATAYDNSFKGIFKYSRHELNNLVSRSVTKIKNLFFEKKFLLVFYKNLYILIYIF